MDVVIDHNPDCGISRNTLAMSRNAGVEPHVVDHPKTPPSRRMVRDLVERAGLALRQALREKGTPYAELGLDDLSPGEDALFDASAAHPILLNRPFVAPKGALPCRPSERVLDLPPPQRGAFRKEDGELVVDSSGHVLAGA